MTVVLTESVVNQYRAQLKNQEDASGFQSKHGGEVLEWMARHQGKIAKFARYQAKLNEWLAAAREGDVEAMLAHPRVRRSLQLLATGAKSAGVGRFTTKRKAVAAAKQRILDRATRQADAACSLAARTAPLGNAYPSLLARWKKLAMEQAVDYHRNVKPLYVSSRAWVEYGRGGNEHHEYPYRGAYKSRPAKWRNAGVRLDNEETPAFVILENHLGNQVARLPFVRTPQEKS